MGMGQPDIKHLPASRRFPKGGWEVRYRDADNMTRRRTFETKQAALDHQASVRTDKNRGDFIDPRQAATKFRVVAEDWYATTADLRPKTRAGYRYILDGHILPALGERPIGKITPSVLRAFLAGLSPRAEAKEELSPTTRRNV